MTARVTHVPSQREHLAEPEKCDQLLLASLHTLCLVPKLLGEIGITQLPCAVDLEADHVEITVIEGFGSFLLLRIHASPIGLVKLVEDLLGSPQLASETGGGGEAPDLLLTLHLDDQVEQLLVASTHFLDPSIFAGGTLRRRPWQDVVVGNALLVASQRRFGQFEGCFDLPSCLTRCVGQLGFLSAKRGDEDIESVRGVPLVLKFLGHVDTFSPVFLFFSLCNQT